MIFDELHSQTEWSALEDDDETYLDFPTEREPSTATLRDFIAAGGIIFDKFVCLSDSVVMIGRTCAY